jgi:hypothetical protein
VYYSGRKEALEGKCGKDTGKERGLGESLGPSTPLPQTKIKTRILKGDLIIQSQRWGKGWAGGHCHHFYSPFLYFHRCGGNGELDSSSQSLGPTETESWAPLKIPPHTHHPHHHYHPAQFSRLVGNPAGLMKAVRDGPSISRLLVTPRSKEGA